MERHLVAALTLTVLAGATLALPSAQASDLSNEPAEVASRGTTTDDLGAGPSAPELLPDGSTDLPTISSGEVHVPPPQLPSLVHASLSYASLVQVGSSPDPPRGPSLDDPLGGVGVAAGATLWILIGRLPLVPLFSRIRREDVLENPTRQALMDRIREEPGIHLAALIEHSGVGNGATRHHMRKLEEAGLVETHELKGYCRYFPAGEFSEDEIERRSVLKAGSNREIYEIIDKRPEVSIRGLARRLDMSPSSVHRSVEMLREVGLLDGDRSNGR